MPNEFDFYTRGKMYPDIPPSEYGVNSGTTGFGGKSAGITAPSYTPNRPNMLAYREPSTIAEAQPIAGGGGSNTTGALNTSTVQQAAAGKSPFEMLPVAASAINAIQIGRDLKRLKRRGQLDVTPQAFRDAIQAQRGLAASTQIPGYSQALDNMNANAQATMGNVNRTVQSGSQALAAATRVGQNQTQNLNRLAMQGMQNQQAQQGRLTSMLGQQGQYQEQGRQEFNRDVAALTGAKRQQWFDTAKGYVQATTVDPATLKMLLGG
jgi:hypothetical protein